MENYFHKHIVIYVVEFSNQVYHDVCSVHSTRRLGQNTFRKYSEHFPNAFKQFALSVLNF